MPCWALFLALDPSLHLALLERLSLPDASLIELDPAFLLLTVMWSSSSFWDPCWRNVLATLFSYGVLGLFSISQDGYIPQTASLDNQRL